MLKRRPGPALTVDGYVATLRQLDRFHSAPRAPLSVLAALLRAGRTSDDWPPRLASAERIAAALTPGGRRALEDGNPSVRERSAALAGHSADEVERFIAHFSEASRVAERYHQSGPWQRLRALAEADPILSRLLGRRKQDRGG